MASHQSFFSRRQNARQPPLLSTAVANNIHHLDTTPNSPYSPPVLSAPFTPGLPQSPLLATHSGPQSPMAARPYQPQQWANSGPVGGSYMPFDHASRGPSRLTLEPTGMEASLPSPPPPYHSPSPTTARTFFQGPNTPSGPLSPALGIFPDGHGQSSTSSSPQLTVQTQFPPPPGAPRPSNRHSPRNLLSLSRLTSRNNDADTRNAQNIQTGVALDAPGSRRAHSTGAIGLAGPSSSRNNLMHSPPQSQSPWTQGMPVPPPPPGPPPTIRSQSSSRLPDRPAPLSSLPTRGAGPSTRPDAAPLSPVPPTPSDYLDDSVDRDFPTLIPSRKPRQLSVDPEDRGVSLARRPAHREASVEAIRDRRSRSRAMREGILIDVSNNDGDSESSSSGSGNSKPANLVLHRSNIPTSSGSDQRGAQSLPSSATREAPKHASEARQPGMPTPPYTPATRPRTAPNSVNRSASTQRSTMRDTDAPDRSIQSITPSRSQEDEDSFINTSLERFLDFGQREAAAATDEDRLLLFAQFVVDESKIRRERYGASFGRVASELYDTTRDMWRRQPLEPPSTAASQVAPSRDQSVDSDGIESRGQSSAALQSSAPSEAELTPATDTESFCSALERDQSNVCQSPWNDRFKPSLSPIPSMTVSTYAGDEADSRGRSASRWWEASDNGSSGTGGRRLERSKQEIKYMSLHPSVMQQALEDQAKSQGSTPNDSDSTTRASAEEYPPEKTGWHEEEPVAGPSRSSSFAAGKRPANDAPPLPSIRRSTLPALDVSRLVTLPPPYPRHYPAVSNNHPQLEAPRGVQRSLADLSELRELHGTFEDASLKKQQEVDEARQARVREFRTAVQSDIDAGRVSHGMAMEADRRFRAHEAEKTTKAVEAAYERFNKDFYEPASELLEAKLQSADETINMMTLALSSSLSSGASERAQVGGDEEPELLEQLTLLKWLFEARETLHKEQHDLTLLSHRQLRTKEKWSPAYRMLNQSAREADNLAWQQSMHALQSTWASTSNTRFQDLSSTVSEHVTRGVEAQLSAFWDVAPQLADVISRIPSSLSPSTDPTALATLDDQLRHLPILIPPTELSETPALRRFPARYLYSTLTHARNSTRQFVDAQIDLLCLQHEIRTAAMVAEVRALETARVGQGGDTDGVGEEMKGAREAEERRLTSDLKGKVGEVEAGWEDALGKGIDGARGMVRGFLERCGGWEEGLG
ncbi:hypothetical protein CAC42_4648 [Sphaceloma murrayae]|uniref:Uncharacterized protein n=1 Tax=Sphaceloma murrayae TaxID=2082308 RepID=A0A2K1QNI8_9PEZI|nr:hypothetical protein CAC42_4648 [Sphaceloma murrayae]